MSILNPTTAVVSPLRSVTAVLLLAGVAVFGVACGGSGSNGSQNTKPSSPTNLSATSGNSQISLSWSGVDAAKTYNVYRATASSSSNPSDSDPVMTEVSNTTYTDSDVTNGIKYVYSVTAVGSNGKESSPSKISDKTTPFSEPGGRPPNP